MDEYTSRVISGDDSWKPEKSCEARVKYAIDRESIYYAQSETHIFRRRQHIIVSRLRSVTQSISHTSSHYPEKEEGRMTCIFRTEALSTQIAIRECVCRIDCRPRRRNTDNLS